jgi:hypothetical protein
MPDRPDPRSITTKQDLLEAVRALVDPRSSSAAAANRVGLGESTIYALRAGRTPHKRTFIKIVDYYDRPRRDDWLDAWDRLIGRPAQPENGRAASAGTVAAAPRRRSRRSLIVAGGGALLVALVVLAIVIRPGGKDRPGGTATSAPALPGGAGCPSPALPTQGPVTAEDGATRAGISISGFSYAYTPAYSPSVELGGGLSRHLRGGEHLFVLDWSDPATTDSTPKRNPGNGRYYPSPELRLTDQNCFSYPRHEMGYGGFTGMRVRSYVVLVGDDVAGAFEREGLARDGYTLLELAQRNVVSLGFLTIQTR